MCYSGACPYEDHDGECVRPNKTATRIGNSFYFMYPEDAVCQLENQEETQVDLAREAQFDVPGVY